MDTAIARVMPDSWPGHARILAYNESDGLSNEARNVAIELAGRLAEKKDTSDEAIVDAAIDKARDRFE